jgi:hypothetical protein
MKPNPGWLLLGVSSAESSSFLSAFLGTKYKLVSSECTINNPARVNGAPGMPKLMTKPATVNYLIMHSIGSQLGLCIIRSYALLDVSHL